MKKFFITALFFVAFMIWVDDWISSGKMDHFIQSHADRNKTPRILYIIGETCFSFQSPKNASHYLAWLVNQYPEKDYIPRARFHLAESYEELGQRGEALNQYVVLKDSFTTTRFGKMAQKRWEINKYR